MTKILVKYVISSGCVWGIARAVLSSPISQRIPVPTLPHLRLVHIPVPEGEHQVGRRRTSNCLQHCIETMVIMMHVSFQRSVVHQVEKCFPCCRLERIRSKFTYRSSIHSPGNAIDDMPQEHTWPSADCLEDTSISLGRALLPTHDQEQRCHDLEWCYSKHHR